ncbi:MAG: helix-turn-helix transcriptional regulator [Oscillospiraceae bacterium]|nr:helix-turn-helix transcriptional regulator [Oscillospiraceae bacterium]
MKYTDYNEKKKHGEPNFPLEYYYVNRFEPLHWHKELEFIRIKTGTMKIFLDNILYTVNAGEQIIIQSGTLHRGVLENCFYECIVFDPAMLCKHKNDIAETYIMPIINRRVAVFPLTAGKPETYDSINLLFDECGRSLTNNELDIYAALYKVFSSLYKENMISQTHSAGRTEKQNQTVGKIIDWIQNNYTENLTLSDIAGVGNLSTKYLCRLFKDYTLMTPVEYINNLRIENACHLMIYSDLSVTDAALESGFNDLSYFIKIFKRYKGITPSEYKKTYKSKS